MKKERNSIPHVTQLNYFCSMKSIIGYLEEYIRILSMDEKEVCNVLPGFTYIQNLATIIEDLNINFKSAIKTLGDDYQFFGEASSLDEAVEAFAWINNFIEVFIYPLENMLDIREGLKEVVSGLDVTLRKIIFVFYDVLDVQKILAEPDNIPDILKEFADNSNIDIIVYCMELSDKFEKKPPFTLIDSEVLQLFKNKNETMGINFIPYLSPLNIADLWLIKNSKLQIDLDYFKRLEYRFTEDTSLYNECKTSLQKVLEKTSPEKYELFYKHELKITVELLMTCINDEHGLDVLLDKFEEMDNGGDYSNIFTGDD